MVDVVDDKPNEPEMRLTLIAASQSSARPKNLKYFATTSRANDSTVRRNLDDFQGAWTAFEAACSWVPVEQMTLVSGGTRWLGENELDATFADTVAAAFEKAGSGGVSNRVLAMILAEKITGRPGRLFQRSLSSYEEVARQWKKLGLPAAARDVASRAVLSGALKDRQKIYAMLGAAEAGLNREDFDKQIN